MKLVDLSSSEEKARSVLRLAQLASLVTVLIVLAYGAYTSLTQDVQVIGLNFVDIEFPPPSISPVYFKPITYLYVASLTLMYSSLELHREMVRRLPSSVRTLIKLLSFVVAVTFSFELLFNLVFWAGQIAAESLQGNLNPDLIFNPFPNPAKASNIVFTSRLWAVFLIAGAYTFHYITQLEKEEREE